MMTHSSRVLIVETSREQRRALRAGLHTAEHSFDVLDVASGEEALLLMARQPVEVLVSGCRLAGIPGVELAQKARLRHPKVKVILLAARSEMAAVRKAANDVQAILAQPVDSTELLQAVQACLKSLGDTRPLSSDKVEKQPEAPASGGPGAWLKRLQKNTAAAVVLLLDATGAPAAQAGQAPAGGPGAALPAALLQALGAAEIVARELGGDPGVHFWGGSRYDACATRLGAGFTVVLILEHSLPPYERSQVQAAVTAAIKDFPGLPSAPQAKPAPVEKPAPPPEPAAPVEPDPALESLFKQTAGRQLKSGDVDDFWDTLASQSDGGNMVNSGAITYEQARRMGLGLDDKSG